NENRLIPVQIGSDSDWQTVCAAKDHTLAIKTNGTLWSWGFNNAGELGLGELWIQSTPAQVGSDTDWQTAVGGEYVTLALKTDGTLWAWGKNENGQLGLGDNLDRDFPSQVGTATDWVYFTCGGRSSAATECYCNVMR